MTKSQDRSAGRATQTPDGSTAARQTNQTTSATADADGGPVVFFFKPNERHGEFCQWYPATFTVSKAAMSALVGHPIDEDDPHRSQPIYFRCAEQFMMYCKAGRFRDAETQRRVLGTDDPKEQKRLGRTTRRFDPARWDEIKSRVVVAGNAAKFGQNPGLKSLLLATGDRVLAEAASQDRVWGIGFTASEAMAHRDRWGENRLGEALMEVRKALREESGE